MKLSKYCKEWRTGSSKLPNFGKWRFINVYADFIKEVCAQRVKDVLIYTRKEMTGCGLKRNFNGVWDGSKPFLHLKSIIAKYRVNFNGKSVSDSLALDGEVT